MIRRGLRNRRIAAVLMAAAMMMTVFSGCSGSNSDSDTKEQGEGEAGRMEGSRGAESVDSEMELTQSEVDTEFTDRDKDGSYSEKGAAFIQLNGSSAKAEGSNVKVSENTVVISREGTYVISGTMEDGQILVEAEDTDKIQIVLNGAQIHCETSAAIYIKQADKVFLTLADGTENRLSGGTEYVDTDENTVDAVVFSKEDLTVNGSGSLWIDADYKHGIVSKDDLVVTGGSLTIDAEKQCMSGKDSVKILDGTFHLTGRGKAVKSENTEESTLGNLYVAGGNFTIDTEDDAFHAGGSILVDEGTFAIKTGDDGFHADVDTVMNGGELQITKCYEGLEGYRVVINGGSIAITASDDGINAAAPNNDSETMDAVNDERTSEPPRMPEGRELPKDGEDPRMPGDGEMPDRGEHPGMWGDGEMPDGGEHPGMRGDGEMPDGGERPEMPPDSEEGRESGFGGKMGGGGMENDTNAYIKITGGTITVDAQGDGLDSNGSLFVSGGTTYVSGPVSGGDGALDYNGEACVSGGTLIAVGSSGMAQGFGETSSQCSILQYLDSNQEAGSTVVLTDEDGTALLNWTSAKEYQSVVLTCPELKEGVTYTLVAGSESSELTLESVVTSNGNGGRGMMHGAGEYQRGERMEKSEQKA